MLTISEQKQYRLRITITKKNGYVLSGITLVAEHLGIGKLVDRDFPNYDYPSRKAIEDSSNEKLSSGESNLSLIYDYIAFIDYQQKHRKTVVERFVPGSREQFTLKHSPGKYPFTVQNIASNGIVWTGKGTETQEVISREHLNYSEHLKRNDENACSCAVKLSYGNFAYYSGGDLTSYPAARDMATPTANVIGRVDAMSMNHHGVNDGTNENFLVKLRPRVLVATKWCPTLNSTTTKQMLDENG
jgi:hypothetical protein